MEVLNTRSVMTDSNVLIFIEVQTTNLILVSFSQRVREPKIFTLES